jgi:hypothetical protein
MLKETIGEKEAALSEAAAKLQGKQFELEQLQANVRNLTEENEALKKTAARREEERLVEHKAVVARLEAQIEMMEKTLHQTHDQPLKEQCGKLINELEIARDAQLQGEQRLIDVTTDSSSHIGRLEREVQDLKTQLTTHANKQKRLRAHLLAEKEKAKHDQIASELQLREQLGAAEKDAQVTIATIKSEHEAKIQAFLTSISALFTHFDEIPEHLSLETAQSLLLHVCPQLEQRSISVSSHGHLTRAIPLNQSAMDADGSNSWDSSNSVPARGSPAGQSRISTRMRKTNRPKQPTAELGACASDGRASSKSPRSPVPRDFAESLTTHRGSAIDLSSADGGNLEVRSDSDEDEPSDLFDPLNTHGHSQALQSQRTRDWMIDRVSKRTVDLLRAQKKLFLLGVMDVRPKQSQQSLRPILATFITLVRMQRFARLTDIHRFADHRIPLAPKSRADGKAESSVFGSFVTKVKGRRAENK